MLFNYFFAALAVIVANVAAYPAAIFDAVATSNSQSAANYQVTSSKLDAYFKQAFDDGFESAPHSVAPVLEVGEIDLQKRGYGLRCNGDKLHSTDRNAATEYVRAYTESGGTLWSYGDATKKVVKKCESAFDQCVHVSYTAFDAISTRSHVADVAAGMDRINKECGDKGGSIGVAATIDGFDGLTATGVVHIASRWA